MEPTDNFSQKKKKDLVAIATLFGILTEEKANRMTKPELIEFLVEQDRISKAASAPVQKHTEDITDEVLLRATDLLISTIENNKQTRATSAVAVTEPAFTPAPAVVPVTAPVPAQVTVNELVHTPAPLPARKIPAASKKAVTVTASPAKPVEVEAAVSAAAPEEISLIESAQTEEQAPAVRAARKAAPVTPKTAVAVPAKEAAPVPAKAAAPVSPKTAAPVPAKAAAPVPAKAAAPVSPKTAAPVSPNTAAVDSVKVSAPAAKKAAVKPKKEEPAKSESESASVNAPVSVPASIQATAPESSREAAPAIVPDIAPAIVPDIAPAIVPDIAPAIVPDIAPAIVPDIAPAIVPAIAPAIVPAPAQAIALTSAPKTIKKSSPRRDIGTHSHNVYAFSDGYELTASPEVLEESAAEIAEGTISDDARPSQKKGRGRPKKSFDEVAEETADAVTAQDVPQVDAKKLIVNRADGKTYKESIIQEELDLEEVISTEVQINRDIDDTSIETANSEPSEKWNQQIVPSKEPSAHKPQESAVEVAPHIIRTKRHSVIIKPKDEEESSLDEEASAGDGSARSSSTRSTSTHSASTRPESTRFESNRPTSNRPGSTRPVSSRPVRESDSKTDESGEIDGTAAPSGEHSDFGAHHARTLRPKEQPPEMIAGVLELMPDGYGFLRRENYLSGQNDIYVPAQYVRRFGLRLGDYVLGPCRPKRDSDRYQSLQYIKEVNGFPPEKMIRRAHFDRLTPIYPEEKYILETDRNELSTRIIDLVAPIGKGQRGMIVSPPKAGKTILLQKIANAISINNPDSKLIVLLIDERPEEVTDMQRSINGEVVYSTFDKTPENHVRIVELVLERAMRLVELGLDVIILLDSITRLARAYNLTINPTGRTLSGGLDPGALYGPKRFFGAARNIEGGGSLTIVATSLIDTGSRMDEVIFEEFKGTGNMEVYLDRRLSEKRIFPAIDINKSGTRHEELLLSPVELDAVWTIRKAFGQLDTSAVTEMIISLLMKTATNNQLIQSINVSFNDKATFDAMRGTRPAGNSTNSGNGK